MLRVYKALHVRIQQKKPGKVPAKKLSISDSSFTPIREFGRTNRPHLQTKLNEIYFILSNLIQIF
jgi:hypothetical protein